MSSTLVTSTIQVSGMSCDHCARAVREEISKLAGVADVNVDLGSGQVAIRATGPIGPAQLRAAVEEAGYEVVR